MYCKTLPVRLKGGKQYIRLYLDQSSVKASMQLAIAPGSGFQATYWDTLQFRLDANISMSGSPHFAVRYH